MLHQMKTLESQRLERFSFCCFASLTGFVHKSAQNAVLGSLFIVVMYGFSGYL